MSVNKPFKVHLRKEYESWLLSGNILLTPSCTIKKAQASKLAYKSQLFQRISQRLHGSTLLRNAALSTPQMVQWMIVSGKIMTAAALSQWWLQRARVWLWTHFRNVLTSFTFLSFGQVHNTEVCFLKIHF